MECVTPGDWYVRDVLNRGNLRLGELDLHLITNSRPWISPVVGSNETAGRCCRYKRAPNLFDINAKLTGKLTIHIYFDAGVIERLLELQIAQGRDFAEFGQKLFCICSIVLQVRPVDSDLDRSGSSKIHRLAHDVPRFERKLASGKDTGQFIS